MISYEEAVAIIAAACKPLSPVRVELSQSLETMLAENVASDVDSPPHDKAMMDGFAILVADGISPRTIIEEVTAGAVPKLKLTPGTTTRIMTGAPVPVGADAVVAVENTKMLAGSEPSNGNNGLQSLGEMQVNDDAIKPGQHIMRRGESLLTGQQVLAKGTCIRPIEIGILAEVGCASPLVVPQPTVAVFATGNELVPVNQKPLPGQIRNSNGPLLTAAVENARAIVQVTESTNQALCDELSSLEEGVSACLEDSESKTTPDVDVIILSGGVSAGVLDLVPGVLKSLGVEQRFHKVSIKPGKPVWFGVHTNQQGKQRYVFGLPGNPVASFVCFELFVRPLLLALAGFGFSPEVVFKQCLQSRQSRKATVKPIAPRSWMFRATRRK